MASCRATARRSGRLSVKATARIAGSASWFCHRESANGISGTLSAICLGLCIVGLLFEVPAGLLLARPQNLPPKNQVFEITTKSPKCSKKTKIVHITARKSPF